MFLPMYNAQVECPTGLSCFYLCFILSEIVFSGMTFAPNFIKNFHFFRVMQGYVKLCMIIIRIMRS